jgi:hypothetical protein
MTDYGLAADWQGNTADRLTAIVLPLVPQIETHPDGSFYWPNRHATAWMFDTIEQIIKYHEFPYQIGDRVYRQERTTYPCWGNDISACTMPSEAAQHWFELTGVKVVQMDDLSLDEARSSYLFDPLTDDLFDFQSVIQKKWNTAYPKYPWDGDRWVVVLEAKQL